MTEVVKFASSAFLKDYIDQMVAKLGDINKDKITILDERKLTNIGIIPVIIWMHGRS